MADESIGWFTSFIQKNFVWIVGLMGTVAVLQFQVGYLQVDLREAKTEIKSIQSQLWQDSTKRQLAEQKLDSLKEQMTDLGRVIHEANEKASVIRERVKE